MGSAASKESTTVTPVARPAGAQSKGEKATYLTPIYEPMGSNATDDLSGRLAKYLVLDGEVSGSNDPLTPYNYLSWERQLVEDPRYKLALNAVNAVDIQTIIRNRSSFVNDNIQEFSDKIELEGTPVTNQRSSGRCWIFASTNVFRVAVQKKYNITDFQLSQAYLFFYDKLEKANFFLDNVIDTADEDLNGRLVQTLFQEPVSDGGQWDMIVNLVSKYGLVPNKIYPDSFNAENSSKLNYFVINKLREYGLILRKLANDKSVSPTSISSVKEKFVHEIYNVLVLALGVPPKPHEPFVWEYTDKDGKFYSVKTNATDFYKKIVGFEASEYFSLIHDPRNAYKALYTVDRLGNISGGKGIEYVNADVDILKKAAIKSIQNNEPVFFGSDVGKFSDSASGIMDTQAWNYEVAFNVDMGLTKAERLQTGSSAMTHAMVLTAVHIVDGKPTKWRVENSWGESAGNKGYFIMSDDWFNEYVYQVVTSSKYAEKEYTNIWKSKKYNVLPRWDPLGALA